MGSIPIDTALRAGPTELQCWLARHMWRWERSHPNPTLQVFPGFFEFCAKNSIAVLGICYGMQLIVKQLGGTVEPAAKREYGRMPIHTVAGSALYGDVTDHTQVRGPSQGLFSAAGRLGFVCLRCWWNPGAGVR